MKIQVNGEDRDVRADTLQALLEELGYGAARVATAVDGDFVPAGRRGTRPVTVGCAVEIVAPMQGG
ncbi:sulfur carrier protein ThiS [Rhizosaccharibacter radicis]|uniref:Sulfur carrier protein ThiS n=1 Tax=Rhizosaccharibacter radicis TaxID=2782605 RepID=A0ABT1VXR8_9PROT|nr:sulfur carrier protein ThiS [Acetobacteraceae bacterium KSS12]